MRIRQRQHDVVEVTFRVREPGRQRSRWHLSTGDEGGSDGLGWQMAPLGLCGVMTVLLGGLLALDGQQPGPSGAGMLMLHVFAIGLWLTSAFLSVATIWSRLTRRVERTPPSLHTLVLRPGRMELDGRICEVRVIEGRLVTADGTLWDLDEPESAQRELEALVGTSVDWTQARKGSADQIPEALQQLAGSAGAPRDE